MALRSRTPHSPNGKKIQRGVDFVSEGAEVRMHTTRVTQGRQWLRFIPAVPLCSCGMSTERENRGNPLLCVWQVAALDAVPEEVPQRGSWICTQRQPPRWLPVELPHYGILLRRLSGSCSRTSGSGGEGGREDGVSNSSGRAADNIRKACSRKGPAVASIAKVSSASQSNTIEVIDLVSSDEN